MDYVTDNKFFKNFSEINTMEGGGWQIIFCLSEVEFHY